MWTTELTLLRKQSFFSGNYTICLPREDFFWDSNDATVLSSELRDSQSSHLLPTDDEYIGIEWNASKDHFRLTVADQPSNETLTKRGLASDVAKT